MITTYGPFGSSIEDRCIFTWACWPWHAPASLRVSSSSSCSTAISCGGEGGKLRCSSWEHLLLKWGSNVNWKCVGEVQGPQGCSSSTVQPNGCSFRVAAVKAAWQYYLAASFHTSLLPDVGSKIRIQDSSRVQLLDYVHSKVVSTQRDTSAFDWRNDGDVLPDTLFTGFILLQGADDELCPLPGQDQLFLVFGAWPHPAHCWLHVSAYDMAFHWQ